MTAATRNNDSDDVKVKKKRQVQGTVALLVVDVAVSVLLMLRLVPILREYDGTIGGIFVFTESFLDLFILAMCRFAAAIVAFLYSYCKAEVRPAHYLDEYRPNGEKKSSEELEEETLEQSVCSWLWNCVARPGCFCEGLAFATTVLCVVKCLCRMNEEIGVHRDADPLHPLYWIAVAFSAIIALAEASTVDNACKNLGELAHLDRQSDRPTWFTRVSSTLSIPLLSEEAELEGGTNGEGDGDADGTGQSSSENEARLTPIVSDIGADSTFKATFSDLLSLCKEDSHLIFLAFVFLILAATAQVLIPHYTGKILDLLVAAYAGDNNPDEDVGNVPGFMSNTVKLIVASILGGIFAGCRGSIFTVVGGNVTARLRLRLMDSLLVQDIGFYDITKAGDIMSRLSSDTALVGDQVTLNVNVLLRSLVQAIGILIFMVYLSWQLSILAFISVPVITILSKWYGGFIRTIAKVMQKKLADANAVSEAAISSMRTVRSFDAGPTEFMEFKKIINRYLDLNNKSAVAYSGYATIATSLPQLVTALVIYYGGLMIRSGDISSGDLVSFLLYLQSLSDAFGSIGAIFTSLTRATGAADKVFELMARKPRMKLPSDTNDDSQAPGIDNSRDPSAALVMARRNIGLSPSTCMGSITIENVKMAYPARPKRTILNDMTLHIPAGKIVALCGSSGGGKSSILSLMQNMYQQESGKVLIDNHEIHELSPSWLAHHVSIVSQEPTLFARSIKRNIIYGLEGSDSEPTDEEIEDVAKLANAHDFISRMPQKYETEVGDRGVQLSGGQKQRIAIARALIRKPKILLLDEATSALDAESEHMVQQSIDQMLQANRGLDGLGTTVVIVAHRLSTIRNADIIYVVKDGQLVEQGSHTDLMAQSGGAYNALVRRQLEVQDKQNESSK